MTYSDSFLTYADDQPCLVKSDLQKHFKRLRKHLEPRSLKYFAVGEYGSLGRPHYHYLVFYKGSLDRFKLLQLIKDDWKFGFSKVLPVRGAQGYVTKYVLKFDKREFLVSPFSMISQGLGIDYLSDSIKLFHRRNLQSFAIKPGGFKITLPRYYKDKIFNDHQKYVMRLRSDNFRCLKRLKEIRSIDACFDIGINPFIRKSSIYERRLYQSLQLYRNKRKL